MALVGVSAAVGLSGAVDGLGGLGGTSGRVGPRAAVLGVVARFLGVFPGLGGVAVEQDQQQPGEGEEESGGRGGPAGSGAGEALRGGVGSVSGQGHTAVAGTVHGGVSSAWASGGHRVEWAGEPRAGPERGYPGVCRSAAAPRVLTVGAGFCQSVGVTPRR